MDFLKDQLWQAKVFYASFDLAYKNGLQVEMIFKIDGQIVQSSIMVNRVRNKQLFEFMANFAAAERMQIQDSIGELDRLRWESVESAGEMPGL
jgi:hypothetical protein